MQNTELDTVRSIFWYFYLVKCVFNPLEVMEKARISPSPFLSLVANGD